MLMDANLILDGCDVSLCSPVYGGWQSRCGHELDTWRIAFLLAVAVAVHRLLNRLDTNIKIVC